MSSRQMRRILIFGGIFICLAICSIFVFRAVSTDSIIAKLPETETRVSPKDPEIIDGLGLDIDILYLTPDNVQEVIATIVRPQAYSRDIMVESFWDEGSTVYNFNVAVRDGATAIRTFSGGTAKNIIISDESVYIWYTGDREAAVLANKGGHKADEYQMVLTYEDILAFDKSNILEAGFINDNNGPGIFIRYMAGVFGYTTECRVSIELGLVTGAEQYSKDRLIYRMTAGETNLEKPATTNFTLPNGASIFMR